VKKEIGKQTWKELEKVIISSSAAEIFYSSINIKISLNLSFNTGRSWFGLCQTRCRFTPEYIREQFRNPSI
jgi:hypothetical protein